MLIVAIYQGSRAVCCVLRVLRVPCKLCMICLQQLAATCNKLASLQACKLSSPQALKPTSSQAANASDSMG